MAGSGLPQPAGIETSNITPSYAVPHDNAIAQALGDAGEVAQGLINDQIKQHFVEVGKKEGALVAADPAGYIKIPVITDVGRAREAAFQASYLANTKLDIDAHIDQLQRDNTLNPAAFKAAADAAINGFAKGAPGPYAVQVQDYARGRAASAYNSLADDKVRADQTAAVNGVNARQTSLNDSLLAMAGAGKESTPEYAATMAEWNALQTSKVANPLFNYTPEQAALAADRQNEQLLGAAVTYHSTQAYNAAGGGEPGKAAALANLKAEALDDGGLLSSMTPAMRLKIYGTAAANITALDKDDALRRQMEAEDKRVAHQAQVDYAGTLSLGLLDGSETEASIRQAESEGKIEAGAAARLISGAQARARSEAAAGRAAAALDRTANYAALSEMAANGQLTPAALAANGAGLTGTQRVALAGKIDKTIAPGVKNITDLAAASFADGGITGAAKELALQNLAVDATTYLRNHPNTTVGQQQAFAAAWVKSTKGLVVPTAASGAATKVQSKAEWMAATKARNAGQSIPQRDLDAGWARYQAANPTAK